MRICCLIIAIACTASADGHKARSKRSNYGTILFTKNDVWKPRWSKREVGLLFSRWYFNHLFPPPFQHDRINVDYIQNLVSYFQQAFTTIDSVASDRENNEIMTAALCDTVGSYLKASALPAVKCSYYAGNIAYPAALRLFQIYDDIKRYLDTDGNRWHTGVMDCRMHIRNTVKRHLITRVKNPCRQLSNLKKLPNGRLSVPTPRVRWNREASLIKIPLVNESIYPLDSPESAAELLFYYVVAHDCLKPKSTSFQHFKDNFVDWFTYDVEPHLRDDRLYPGLGGVLFLVDNDNIESAYINKNIEDDDFKYISDSVNKKADTYNWSSALMIILLIIMVELLWCVPTLMCMWCYKRKRKYEPKYSRMDVEHAHIQEYPNSIHSAVRHKKRSNLKTSIKTKDDILNNTDVKNIKAGPSRSETKLEIIRFNKSANVMTQMSHRSTIDGIPKHNRATDTLPKQIENRHAFTDADLIKISEVSTSLPSLDKQLFLVDEQSVTPSIDQARSSETNNDEKRKTTVAHDKNEYFFKRQFSITDSQLNNFCTSNDNIIVINKCLETKKKVSYPDIRMAVFPNILSNDTLLIEEENKPSDSLISSSSMQDQEQKSNIKDIMLSFENIDGSFSEQTSAQATKNICVGTSRVDPENVATSMQTSIGPTETPPMTSSTMKEMENIVILKRHNSDKCASHKSYRETERNVDPKGSIDNSDSCESTQEISKFRNLANSKSKSATVNTVTALNLIRTLSYDPFVRDVMKCRNRACACQTLVDTHPKDKKTQQFVAKKTAEKKRCFEVEVDLPSNTDIYVELEGLKLPKPSKIPKIKFGKKENVHFGPSTLTTMPCVVQPRFCPGTRIPIMKSAKDAALRKKKRNEKTADLNSTF